MAGREVLFFCEKILFSIALSSDVSVLHFDYFPTPDFYVLERNRIPSSPNSSLYSAHKQPVLLHLEPALKNPANCLIRPHNHFWQQLQMHIHGWSGISGTLSSPWSDFPQIQNIRCYIHTRLHDELHGSLEFQSFSAFPFARPLLQTNLLPSSAHYNAPTVPHLLLKAHFCFVKYSW